MRRYRKLIVELSDSEERELRGLLRGGVQPVRVIKRVQVLRLLAEGQTPPQVGRSVGSRPRRCGRLGGGTGKEACPEPCMTGPGLGRSPGSHPRSSSGLSPWSVGRRRRGGRAGPSD